MRTVVVLHLEHSDFFSETLKSPDDYKVMAVFDVGNSKESVDIESALNNRALNVAYRLSQNIDNAWNDPPCRSTSVNDLFLLQEAGKVFMVARIGFKEITDETFVKAIRAKMEPA